MSRYPDDRVMTVGVFIFAFVMMLALLGAIIAKQGGLHSAAAIQGAAD